MVNRAAQDLPAPRDYDELARDWYRFTLALVGSKGRVAFQDVGDVVQVIFTRAWKSQILDKFNPEFGPFSNFWVVYVFRSVYGIREQMWVEAPRWPVTPEGIVPEAKPYDDRTLHRILAVEEYQEFRAYLASIKRQGRNSPPWEEVLDAAAEVFLTDPRHHAYRPQPIDPLLLSDKLGMTYAATRSTLVRLQAHAKQWRIRRALETYTDAA